MRFGVPIVSLSCSDCGFYFRQERSSEAVAQCSKDVFLGREIKIEGPFRDLRARGDLLDCHRSNPMLEKQNLGGVHEFLAPLFRWLGPRTRLGLDVHWIPRHWQESARCLGAAFRQSPCWRHATRETEQSTAPRPLEF